MDKKAQGGKQAYKKLKASLSAVAGANFVVFPFLVATVELTIRYNHLESVGDLTHPGQLIPFLSGVAALADSVLYLVRPEKSSESRSDETTFAMHRVGNVAVQRDLNI